jgi:hypothetical protein
MSPRLLGEVTEHLPLLAGRELQALSSQAALKQLSELLRGQPCVTGDGTHGDGVDGVMAGDHKPPFTAG